MVADDVTGILCCAILGGFIGSIIAYHIMGNNRKTYFKMLEQYWNKDIKRIRVDIETVGNECEARHRAMVHELSTKKVCNCVNNSANISHGKPIC